jgi:hypothetical protein
MAKLALRVNGGNREIEIESDDPDVPLLSSAMTWGRRCRSGRIG